jgi:hypothetical protein
MPIYPDLTPTAATAATAPPADPPAAAAATAAQPGRPCLRSDDPRKLVIEAVNNLQDKAEILTSTVAKGKERLIDRAAAALDGALEALERILKEEVIAGKITADERRGYFEAAWLLYEAAIEARDDFKAKIKEAEAAAAAAKADSDRRELLGVLAGELDVKEAEVYSKVKKSMSKLQNGDLIDDADVEYEIEDLETSFGDLKAAAAAVEATATLNDPIKGQGQGARS